MKPALFAIKHNHAKFAAINLVGESIGLRISILKISILG